jgi:hypothetical protein
MDLGSMTTGATDFTDLHNLVTAFRGVTTVPSEPPYYQAYPGLPSLYAPGSDNGATGYYNHEIRLNLTTSQWPITFVGFSGTGENYQTGAHDVCRSPDTCQLAIFSGSGLGHFVVITGVSDKTLWDRDSNVPIDSDTNWRWIRVFNPFTNGSEYYRANWFYKIQGDYYQHGIMWIKNQ